VERALRGAARGGGRGVLHVARSTKASSLLAASARLRAAIPEAAPEGRESVELTTVDDVLADALPSCRRILLKLDVQGSERAALEGARASLERIALVEAELPRQPLYEGAASFSEVHAWLAGRGFAWVGLAPNSVQRDGTVLEVDALFARLAAR